MRLMSMMVIFAAAISLVACGSHSSSGSGGGTDTTATADTGAGADGTASTDTGTVADMAGMDMPGMDMGGGTDDTGTTATDTGTTGTDTGAAPTCDTTKSQCKCMSAADEATFKASSSSEIAGKLKNCTLPCGSKSDAEGPGCIAACMGKDPAPIFSADCSTCYGDYGWCAFKQCLAPCLADAAGADCKNCLKDKGCTGGYETCSGRTYN